MGFSDSPFSVIVRKPKVYADNTSLYSIINDEFKKYGTGCSLNHIDVSGVSSMNFLFAHRKFNGKYPDISEWDTRNVRHADMMFSRSDFDGDISGWDTGNMETMSNMFSMNISFNCDISGWNTGNVYDMNSLFYMSDFDCDISKWDVRKVRYMQCMFYGNKCFRHDISCWELESVENMSAMFADSGFNVDVGKWAKYVKSETNVRDMFKNNDMYTYDRDVFRHARSNAFSN